MSFHGALVGIIIATILFSSQKNTKFVFTGHNCMRISDRNFFRTYCKFH